MPYGEFSLEDLQKGKSELNIIAEHRIPQPTNDSEKFTTIPAGINLRKTPIMTD
jgi:hypothetical protein